MNIVTLLVGLLIFAKGISIILVFLFFDILKTNTSKEVATFFDIFRLSFFILECGPALIVIFVHYKAYSHLKKVQDQYESCEDSLQSSVSDYIIY